MELHSYGYTAGSILEEIRNWQSASVDFGPLAASATPFVILNLSPNITTRAVPHWFDLSLATGASIAAFAQFFLYDGAVQVGTPIPIWSRGSQAEVLYGRMRFTPTAGSHSYSLRMSMSGGTWTVYNSIYTLNATLKECQPTFFPA